MVCATRAGVAELADARDLKSYLGGLLKSLMTWAIPLSFLHESEFVHFVLFVSLW